MEEDNVNYWSLVEESNFYKRKFEESGPRAGLLDGSASRGVLMETGVEQRDLRRIWDMADIDCDGCLDLEEFISMVPGPMRHEFSSEELGLWFAQADRDGNGILTVDEYFLWSLTNAMASFGANALASVFAKLDKRS